MRGKGPPLGPLVDNSKDFHLKSFAADLVFEIIPVWWFSMELLKSLKLNFSEVASEEELGRLDAGME